MEKLIGKKIILGINGSIACYKSPELIRNLRNHGAEVRVITTKSVEMFINPVGLKTMTRSSKTDRYYSALSRGIKHVELAKWADFILIAPATANFIAHLAAGFAKDLLSTLCLTTRVPIAIAPAMNQKMYQSLATQENIEKLIRRGIMFWGPTIGKQACGNIGMGRMLEPINLVERIVHYFFSKKPLKNIKIMLTAGPTRELLDPIRFISNQSSGKMGFSIASAAAELGATITLITGPVNLSTPIGVINRIDVVNAIEMKDAVMKTIHQQNIFIGCAAVSDYRPVNFSKDKIKKNDNFLKISLIKNPDIIKTVGLLSENRPYVVGFAAETNDLEINAKKKRIDKHIDLICANDISKENQGIDKNDNSLYLFWDSGKIVLSLKDKKLLAKQLINQIIHRYNEKN